MKKLILLLFISTSLFSQEYFGTSVKFGVTPLGNSTDKLAVLDTQGLLNKSTITVQELTDILNIDLSNYVTKTSPENITGEKTFIKGSGGGGFVLDNTSTGIGSQINNVSTGFGSQINNTSTGAGSYIDNTSGGIGSRINNISTGFGSYINNASTGAGSYIDNTSGGIGSQIVNISTGFGSYIDNVSGGIGSRINNTSTGFGSYINNASTGAGSYINNTSLSTGDSYVINKDGLGTVFKIDNVGNTTTQKLNIEYVDEDFTADKILVTGATGEVKSVPKSSITEGYLPLDGSKEMTGTLIYKGVSISGQNIFNVKYAGLGTINNAFTQRGTSNYTLGYGVNIIDGAVGLVSSTDINIPRSVLELTNNGIVLGVAPQQSTAIGQPITNMKKYNVFHEGNQTINNWVVYGNTGVVQNIPANTLTVVNNDGGYTNNNSIITSLYNTSTQKVDLSQAKQGDSLNMTMELDVTTNTNDQIVYMTYTGSVGTVDEWTVRISNETLFKNKGTRPFTCSFKVPLEFANDITAPAEIKIFSDGALGVITKYHSLTIN